MQSVFHGKEATFEKERLSNTRSYQRNQWLVMIFLKIWSLLYEFMALQYQRHQKKGQITPIQISVAGNSIKTSSSLAPSTKPLPDLILPPCPTPTTPGQLPLHCCTVSHKYRTSVTQPFLTLAERGRHETGQRLWAANLSPLVFIPQTS